MTPASSQVKSAERALAVLELLAGAHRPLPSMTIARRCQMPKSSTHRLLNVLRDRGWAVYHAAERGWLLGPSARLLVEARVTAAGCNGHGPARCSGNEPSPS